MIRAAKVMQKSLIIPHSSSIKVQNSNDSGNSFYYFCDVVKLILIDMACNADFVQYIVDQCSGAGEIMTKKMFGDYGIYCDGIIFGLICDDRLYVKPTEAARLVLKNETLCPPYEGAKDYFYIADVDDRDYLSALVRATCNALPEPKNHKR